MSSTIIVAICSLVGTAIGTIGGILASNKLINFRLDRLEKKVELHNNVVMRVGVLDEKMSVANHRIDDLEKKVKC